ncbi:MAG: hypothetical protein U1F77_17505 [Kiritimatiellia bacterium]
MTRRPRRRHFRHALHCPRNLGEARHLLANQSDIHFHLGEALKAAGKVAEARALEDRRRFPRRLPGR